MTPLQEVNYLVTG